MTRCFNNSCGDVPDRKCVPVFEETVELRAVAFKLSTFVKYLAESFLYFKNSFTYCDLSSKSFFQIWCGR